MKGSKDCCQADVKETREAAKAEAKETKSEAKKDLVTTKAEPKHSKAKAGHKTEKAPLLPRLS